MTIAILETGTTNAIVSTGTTTAIITTEVTTPTGVNIVGQHATLTFDKRADQRRKRRQKCTIIINGRIVRIANCNVEGKISRFAKVQALSKITHTLSTPIQSKLGSISRGTLESKILRTMAVSLQAKIPELKAAHDLITNNLYEIKLKKIKKMWEEYKNASR